jgi:hypothetical protein
MRRRIGQPAGAESMMDTVETAASHAQPTSTDRLED